MRSRVVVGTILVVVGTLSAGQAHATIIQPGSIAGLRLWLDATDSNYTTTTSGSVVMANKAGASGVDGATVTAGSPTLTSNVINGRSAVYFDGVDDGMKASTVYSLFGTPSATSTKTAASDAKGTIFCVFQPGTYTLSTQANGNNVMQFDRNGTGSSLLALIANGTTTSTGTTQACANSSCLIYRKADMTLSGFNATNSITANTPYLADFGFDNSATDVKQFAHLTSYVNDAFTTTTVGTTTASLDYNTVDVMNTGRLNLGYNPGNAHFQLKGYFAEALVYNTALTSEQIAGVREYLEDKYTAPEPGTLMLVLTGACGIAAYAWRKRR